MSNLQNVEDSIVNGAQRMDRQLKSMSPFYTDYRKTEIKKLFENQQPQAASPNLAQDLTVLHRTASIGPELNEPFSNLATSSSNQLAQRRTPPSGLKSKDDLSPIEVYSSSDNIPPAIQAFLHAKDDKKISNIMNNIRDINQAKLAEIEKNVDSKDIIAAQLTSQILDNHYSNSMRQSKDVWTGAMPFMSNKQGSNPVKSSVRSITSTNSGQQGYDGAKYYGISVPQTAAVVNPQMTSTTGQVSISSNGGVQNFETSSTHKKMVVGHQVIPNSGFESPISAPSVPTFNNEAIERQPNNLVYQQKFGLDGPSLQNNPGINLNSLPSVIRAPLLKIPTNIDTEKLIRLHELKDIDLIPEVTPSAYVGNTASPSAIVRKQPLPQTMFSPLVNIGVPQNLLSPSVNIRLQQGILSPSINIKKPVPLNVNTLQIKQIAVNKGQSKTENLIGPLYKLDTTNKYRKAPNMIPTLKKLFNMNTKVYPEVPNMTPTLKKLFNMKTKVYSKVQNMTPTLKKLFRMKVPSTSVKVVQKLQQPTDEVLIGPLFRIGKTSDTNLVKLIPFQKPNLPTKKIPTIKIVPSNVPTKKVTTAKVVTTHKSTAKRSTHLPFQIYISPIFTVNSNGDSPDKGVLSELVKHRGHRITTLKSKHRQGEQINKEPIEKDVDAENIINNIAVDRVRVKVVPNKLDGTIAPVQANKVKVMLSSKMRDDENVNDESDYSDGDEDDQNDEVSIIEPATAKVAQHVKIKNIDNIMLKRPTGRYSLTSKATEIPSTEKVRTKIKIKNVDNILFNRPTGKYSLTSTATKSQSTIKVTKHIKMKNVDNILLNRPTGRYSITTKATKIPIGKYFVTSKATKIPTGLYSVTSTVKGSNQVYQIKSENENENEDDGQQKENQTNEDEDEDEDEEVQPSDLQAINPKHKKIKKIVKQGSSFITLKPTHSSSMQPTNGIHLVNIGYSPDGKGYIEEEKNTMKFLPTQTFIIRKSKRRKHKRRRKIRPSRVQGQIVEEDITTDMKNIGTGILRASRLTTKKVFRTKKVQNITGYNSLVKFFKNTSDDNNVNQNENTPSAGSSSPTGTGTASQPTYKLFNPSENKYNNPTNKPYTPNSILPVYDHSSPTYVMPYNISNSENRKPHKETLITGNVENKPPSIPYNNENKPIASHNTVAFSNASTNVADLIDTGEVDDQSRDKKGQRAENLTPVNTTNFISTHTPYEMNNRSKNLQKQYQYYSMGLNNVLNILSDKNSTSPQQIVTEEYLTSNRSIQELGNNSDELRNTTENSLRRRPENDFFVVGEHLDENDYQRGIIPMNNSTSVLCKRSKMKKSHVEKRREEKG